MDPDLPASPGWASVQRYLTARRSPATRKAYAACLRQLDRWASAEGVGTLPVSPDHLALFLASKADEGKALSTLRSYVAAIGSAHRSKGVADPTAAPLIQELVGGIARTSRKSRVRKAALSAAELRAMIDRLPATLLGLRDRAILAFGFAAALRRSELAALYVEDLAFGVEGVEVLIRRSKGDQVSEGQRIFVPRGGEPCPVAALENWLQVSGIAGSFVFRRVSHADKLMQIRLQGQAIAGIVHRAAKGVGLDASWLAGHSLRSGFATTAANNGAST